MSLPSPSLRITGMALFVFERIYPTPIERKAHLACCIRWPRPRKSRHHTMKDYLSNKEIQRYPAWASSQDARNPDLVKWRKLVLHITYHTRR